MPRPSLRKDIADAASGRRPRGSAVNPGLVRHQPPKRPCPGLRGRHEGRAGPWRSPTGGLFSAEDFFKYVADFPDTRIGPARAGSGPGS
jgi:hypothetical protein